MYELCEHVNRGGKTCPRNGYGFEIKKDFHKRASSWIDGASNQVDLFHAKKYNRTEKLELG